MKKTIVIATLAAGLALLAALSASAESAEAIGRDVLAEYGRIQAALAADSIDGVAEAAAKLAETVRPCECTAGEAESAERLVTAVRGLDGTDLATLREQFKSLSRALPAYLEAVGVEATQLYYCPMAKAYWLQPKEESATRNPYFGKAMASCGVKVEAVGG